MQVFDDMVDSALVMQQRVVLSRQARRSDVDMQRNVPLDCVSLEATQWVFEQFGIFASTEIWHSMGAELATRLSPENPETSLVLLSAPASQVAAGAIVACDSHNSRDSHTALVTTYTHLSHEELVAQVVSRDAKVEQLKRRLTHANQIARRTDRRVEELQQIVVAPRKQELLAVVRKGSAQRYMSEASHYSLATRRNLGHIAGRHIGAVLLDGCAKETVYRAEIKRGAALLADSQRWHKEQEEQDGPRQGEGAFRIAVHAFRGDATNSKLGGEGSKVHNLELESIISDGPIMDGNVESSFEHHQPWADLTPCTDGTALGARRMVIKQLRSCGCPTWTDVIQQIQHARREYGSRILRIHVYCATTDQGSDEAKFRRMAQVEVKDY